MNELKQIRSMAELILEKVDALEGAQPYTKDIGFDHLAREHEAKPKFKIGDAVHYELPNGKLIEGVILSGRLIDQLYYPYYQVKLCESGAIHTVYEEYIKPLKQAPKFKVGDRVRHRYNADTVGTITKVYPYTDVPYVMLDDNDQLWANKEDELIAIEPERVWHSGPPPHVGWWNASNAKWNDTWRWWNGTSWSTFCTENMSLSSIARLAVHIEFNQQGIKWTDYWPENARVPRIDPGVSKMKETK